MKNYLGQKKALEDKLETAFRRLTDAELRGDLTEFRRQKENVAFYKAELEALQDSVRKPFKMGAI